MEETLRIAIARMETKLDTILENQEDHETRLRTLEGKGGKRWEAMVGQAISILVAAICGMLAGKVL